MKELETNERILYDGNREIAKTGNGGVFFGRQPLMEHKVKSRNFVIVEVVGYHSLALFSKI